MKTLFTLLLLSYSLCLSAQQTNTTQGDASDTSRMVSVVADFIEKDMACKDGYAIEGYIVNISYDQAKKMDGKKIKISGHYTIIKGLENLPKEYDKDGNEIIMQGRQHDIKHIESPTIEIIGR